MIFIFENKVEKMSLRMINFGTYFKHGIGSLKKELKHSFNRQTQGINVRFIKPKLNSIMTLIVIFTCCYITSRMLNEDENEDDED